MIKVIVALKDAEGHRSRSKIIEYEQLVISCKLLHQQTSYKGSIHLSDIKGHNFLGSNERSRSHVKVKGHRRRGVCVL